MVLPFCMRRWVPIRGQQIDIMDRFSNPTGCHYSCLSTTFGEGPLRTTQATMQLQQEKGRFNTAVTKWQNGLNQSEDFVRKKTCCQQVGPLSDFAISQFRLTISNVAAY